MAIEDDDDVQLLSVDGRPVEFNCEICHVSLTTKSISERQIHYEQHFDAPLNQPEAGPSRVVDLSSSEDSMRGGGSLKTVKLKKSEKKAENEQVSPLDRQNVFWHQSQDSPPPLNFTPGLIPILKQALLTSHSRDRTVRAALCHDAVVHVGTERWDMGWGCGYRNFLMACTALMDQQMQPSYFPALDQPSPPGVRNLQHWIEDAWKAGFDPEGAADLKGTLTGTSKWIGTAELYTAFLSRGIPSRLVDFPHVESCGIALLHWVVSYFEEPSREAREMRLKAKAKTTVDEALRGASPVVLTDRMPLVLQHKGHSRTIVGYERTKDGSINLLCFDPSRRPPPQIRNTALHHFYSSRPHQDPLRNRTENKQHYVSPSKVINSLLHPRMHKERDACNSPSNGKKRELDENTGRDSKRPRGGLRAPGGLASANGEVIEISDDDEGNMEVDRVTSPSKSLSPGPRPEADYAKVLDFFRLKPKKVEKNDRYQILYFPLEALFTKEERLARRIVLADVVH